MPAPGATVSIDSKGNLVMGNVFNMRNGIKSGISNFTKRSYLDDKLKWVLSGTTLLVNLDLLTYAHIANGVAPVYAWPLAVYRATAVKTLDLKVSDLDPTECVDVAAAGRDPRHAASAAKARQACEIDYRTLVKLAIAIPFLNGRQIVRQGHHFLSKESKAEEATLEMFGIKDRYARDADFMDTTFHASHHPIDMDILSEITLRKDASRMLTIVGIGTVAIRLPPIPQHGADVANTLTLLKILERPLIRYGHTQYGDHRIRRGIASVKKFLETALDKARRNPTVQAPRDVLRAAGHIFRPLQAFLKGMYEKSVGEENVGVAGSQTAQRAKLEHSDCWTAGQKVKKVSTVDLAGLFEIDLAKMTQIMNA